MTVSVMSSGVGAVRQRLPEDELVAAPARSTWSPPAVSGLVAAALVAAAVAAGAASWDAGAAEPLAPGAVHPGAVTGGPAAAVPHPRPGTLPQPDR